MLNVVVPRSAFWPQTIQSAKFSFRSSEFGTPPPHPQGSVAPPPFGSNSEDTLARGGGSEGGGSNSEEGIDRLELYVYFNPSTLLAFFQWPK
jgi:hypothetical protein